jgi:nucleoside-diphosphate-sugar epimerase
MYNNLPISDFQEIANNLGEENNQKFAGKTICLLGGSGFLGTIAKIYFLYLNKYILKSPCKILSIDNYIGRERPSEIQDINLIHYQHDIEVPLELKLWDQSIDFILNFSGHASPCGPNGYELWPIETMTTGFIGTLNSLKLAVQNKAAIVLFSSSEVLGTPPDNEIPTPEGAPSRIWSTNKRSSYDTIKLCLEALGWNFRQKYGLNVKCLRLFNCVGYFNLNDKRVIPNYFSKALRNEKITVFSPGSQTRSLSFFTDVLTGILLVLLNGKDYLYHCGKDTEEISMLELAHKVEKVCKKKGLVELVPTPPVYKEEPKRRCPKIDEIRKLGFEPKVSLDEMLQRLYSYYKTVH